MRTEIDDDARASTVDITEAGEAEYTDYRRVETLLFILRRWLGELTDRPDGDPHSAIVASDYAWWSLDPATGTTTLWFRLSLDGKAWRSCIPGDLATAEGRITFGGGDTLDEMYELGGGLDMKVQTSDARKDLPAMDRTFTLEAFRASVLPPLYERQIRELAIVLALARRELEHPPLRSTMSPIDVTELERGDFDYRQVQVALAQIARDLSDQRVPLRIIQGVDPDLLPFRQGPRGTELREFLTMGERGEGQTPDIVWASGATSIGAGSEYAHPDSAVISSVAYTLVAGLAGDARGLRHGAPGMRIEFSTRRAGTATTTYFTVTVGKGHTWPATVDRDQILSLVLQQVAAQTRTLFDAL